MNSVLEAALNENRITDPPFRPDYRATHLAVGNCRSEDRLRAHYLLERKLACRLRTAPLKDRARTYNEVYAELFQTLPDHPQANGRHSTHRERHVLRLLARLESVLGQDKFLLEIGCGDARLSVAVAAHVAQVYALDVTDALIERQITPPNLDVLLTSGTEIPLPCNSIDIAISDQLIEHLHPEDIITHLSEVFRVLKSGGVYYCATPNKVTGPHDISCFFDYEASGFHLREYDSISLRGIFKAAGFHKIQFLIPWGRLNVPIPLLVLRVIEDLLCSLPKRVRAWAVRRPGVWRLMGLNVVAMKT